MSIRPLPPVPTRDDPANFALKGDAFLAALPDFRNDCNALIQSLQLVATTGTSTSSLTVGLGSKSLTTDPGKAWATGAWVYVFASAAVSNYMVGRVTSYDVDTGALVVNVSAIDGSGTHVAWIIGLATPAADGHLLPRDGTRAMTAELPLAGDAVNALGAVPKQQLEEAIDAALGSIVVYRPGQRVELYAPSIPAGSNLLKANGAAVSVATYAAMAAAIYCGDANNATASWGYRCTDSANPSGSRLTTGAFIVLPDARGRFNRGWADNGAIDSGRSLWAYQNQALQEHSHRIPVGSSEGDSYTVTNGSSTNQDIYTDNTGGSETRPVNDAALVCIGY